VNDGPAGTTVLFFCQGSTHNSTQQYSLVQDRLQGSVHSDIRHIVPTCLDLGMHRHTVLYSTVLGNAAAQRARGLS
jgi:hypothetical protein